MEDQCKGTNPFRGYRSFPSTTFHLVTLSIAFTFKTNDIDAEDGRERETRSRMPDNHTEYNI